MGGGRDDRGSDDGRAGAGRRADRAHPGESACRAESDRLRHLLRGSTTRQDRQLHQRARRRPRERRPRRHRARHLAGRPLGLRVRRQPARRPLRRADRGRLRREQRLGRHLGSGRDDAADRLVGRDSYPDHDPEVQARTRRLELQRAATAAAAAGNDAVGEPGRRLRGDPDEPRGPAHAICRLSISASAAKSVRRSAAAAARRRRAPGWTPTTRRAST